MKIGWKTSIFTLVVITAAMAALAIVSTLTLELRVEPRPASATGCHDEHYEQQGVGLATHDDKNKAIKLAQKAAVNDAITKCRENGNPSLCTDQSTEEVYCKPVGSVVAKGPPKIRDLGCKEVRSDEKQSVWDVLFRIGTADYNTYSTDYECRATAFTPCLQKCKGEARKTSP